MVSLAETPGPHEDPSILAWLEQLRAASRLPGGEAIIRQEILKGTIRVAPKGRGELEILPAERLRAPGPEAPRSPSRP